MHVVIILAQISVGVFSNKLELRNSYRV